MFLEHAILEVVPGQEPAFEAAFAEAKEIIGAMPGFLGLTISRCIERPSRYLLLVEWGRLEDHTGPGRDAMQGHRPRLLEPASSKRERVPPKRGARSVR